MPSIWEGMSTCVWFDAGEKRNSLAAMGAGMMFFFGWALIVDSHIVHPTDFYGVYHLCGIVGTISFVMINSVTQSQIQGDIYSGGCLGPRGARLWLFTGFVLGFAAVIAASWILFSEFVGVSGVAIWVGVSIFLQNILIFGSSLLFKFGRIEDQWG